MQKLKAVIEQHGRWKDIEVFVSRIEAYAETDFSLSLENAKALLETIGKEICKIKDVTLPNTSNMNAVLKSAFIAIGYKSEELVNQISRSLATIGQQMGNLRNDIGSTSHGMTIEELKNRNNKIDHLAKEFLIDSTEIVASLLIRGFETSSPLTTVAQTEEKISEYQDNSDFNEFWDDSFGEFVMGEYSYLASEILYNIDPRAYAVECKMFNVETE